MVAGPCWLWTGIVNRDGYGIIGTHALKSRLAHRAVWEMFNGEIPEGLEPDHLCRVRHCVNPAHIELVSHQENMLRGETIAAKHAAKLTCIHGHHFTPENTRIDKAGARHCRKCHAQQVTAALKRKVG